MLSKALVVARWEFMATIRRRSYLFAVIALPLVYAGMAAVGGFAGRATAARTAVLPIAIVDRSGIVDVNAAASHDETPTRFVADRDIDHALGELRSGRVAAVFLIGADYLETGVVSEYSRDSGFFAQPTERQRQNRVGDALRASLLKSSMSGSALKRATSPIDEVKRLVMNAQGVVQPSDDDSGVGAFGVFYVLLMSIFLSAGFLQQATIEERQNRMLEILLSSIDSDELLLGKLMGLGAAGLLQVSVYLLLIIVPGATLLAFFKVSLVTVLLSLLYFGIAYLLFAGLMTGTGMLGRTPHESAQYATLWTIAAAAPLFFIRAIGSAPNGLVARALSFFPLTGPTTMMLRLTSGDVPASDIALSIAIGLVTIYTVLRGAARIFRAASLMYGKRPTLPELVRWLRASA